MNIKIITKEQWLPLSTPLEREMFTKTLEHPFFGKFIEFVDIEDIIKIANPLFQEATDNGNWDDPVTLSLNDLFNDIRSRGMRDPMFLGIGLETSMVRLETGNQRIQIFKRNGIRFIPVVGYIGLSQITNTGNGIHKGIECVLKMKAMNFMGPYQLYHFDKVSEYI